MSQMSLFPKEPVAPVTVTWNLRLLFFGVYYMNKVLREEKNFLVNIADFRTCSSRLEKGNASRRTQRH